MADVEETPLLGSVAIERSDVRLALDAGFSADEVAFMLDLDDPAPEASLAGAELAQNDKKPPPR